MSISEAISFSLVAMLLVVGVLLLLSLIIRAFPYIFKFVDSVADSLKGKKKEEEIKSEVVKPAPKKEEPATQVVDETEIVAAIMAALSESLEVSSDELVIRSIKRLPQTRERI